MTLRERLQQRIAQRLRAPSAAYETLFAPLAELPPANICADSLAQHVEDGMRSIVAAVIAPGAIQDLVLARPELAESWPLGAGCCPDEFKDALTWVRQEPHTWPAGIAPADVESALGSVDDPGAALVARLMQAGRVVLYTTDRRLLPERECPLSDFFVRPTNACRAGFLGVRAGAEAFDSSDSVRRAIWRWTPDAVAHVLAAERAITAPWAVWQSVGGSAVGLAPRVIAN